MHFEEIRLNNFCCLVWLEYQFNIDNNQTNFTKNVWSKWFYLHHRTTYTWKHDPHAGVGLFVNQYIQFYNYHIHNKANI